MEIIDLKSTESRTIIDFSKFGIHFVAALGHYNYKNVQDKLPMHSHKEMIEICFLDKGIQNYTIENEKYVIRGGDILITKPGQLHGTENFHEEKGSLFWLLVNIKSSKKNEVLNLSKEAKIALIDGLLNLTEVQFKADKEVKSILKSIFKLCSLENDQFNKLQISSNILTLLLHVIHLGSDRKEKKLSTAISIACNHIVKNLHNDLNLEQIAAICNLSESRFKHKFKNELGVPPAEYILRQKIKVAKIELEDQKNNISDIAYQLNFETPSYFSTAFKRIVGQSPTKFRKLKVTE
ncbi:AraC family transcriptional regulator [Algoriphagus aquimarinus]|uniref:AraC family transcriptional regulator n=1 Tax=Algoriphagus aquimarinus TaxID=237018 RepID=UPI0030D83452|tara:strand:- start:5496 stop:6377 length:882 start_codon:yes stop_codon:yes gene_type:complete